MGFREVMMVIGKPITYCDMCHPRRTTTAQTYAKVKRSMIDPLECSLPTNNRNGLIILIGPGVDVVGDLTGGY